MRFALLVAVPVPSNAMGMMTQLPRAREVSHALKNLANVCQIVFCEIELSSIRQSFGLLEENLLMRDEAKVPYLLVKEYQIRNAIFDLIR